MRDSKGPITSSALKKMMKKLQVLWRHVKEVDAPRQPLLLSRQWSKRCNPCRRLLHMGSAVLEKFEADRSVVWQCLESIANNSEMIFGAFVGHVIEFQVDRPKDDTIQLTYEGWFILKCERVLNVNSKQFQLTPYSFFMCLSRRELCVLYLKNNALLDQILTLVEEIHSSGDRIIDFFNGKSDALSCSSTSSDSDDDVNFANDPSILRYIIIQALKESAVVGAKILVLCDIFSKRKNELCRAERHELIEYFKNRLPDFMKQLHRFLEVIEISLGNLTPAQRIDIAAYFLFQILNMFWMLYKWKHNVGQALGKSLKNALHMRELMKLRSFHERVLASFMNLMHKKEVFSDMNSANKTRSVANNLEWFIVEIPMFMLRTKELTAALDEKLTFKEWKYWFKLGTSRVAWVLNRLACHRETLDSIIRQIDHMVESEQFSRCLVQLSLLDAPSSAASPSSCSKMQFQSNGPRQSEIKSFHESPVASESRLARSAVAFLKKALILI
ncbi:BTB domain-containing protein [Caerostris extrusa]|uniref:BTB domain-containing protein n=1 Tax=Caerostris extrusa TaxID=172846 RepID=A0AAV4QJ97_CAEEX|nr:BTB domain-containing protein [Caerostris extrusa]